MSNTITRDKFKISKVLDSQIEIVYGL
jgi:hypothetical protein